MHTRPGLPDPLDTARRFADGLRATVQLARELVASRRAVDLAGLDQQVGLLCAKALDLPPEQSAAILPSLYHLAGAVDALEIELFAAFAPASPA
jgi:hypothetical protein